MVELIQQLLLSNNCVIIPNFGAFIGNYNPAEIRMMENKILPPSKAIAFNRSLQNNDGVLINAVAKQFFISYHDAEIKVMDFARQYNESLHEHRSIIFKEIGKLVIDAENNIQFLPYYSKNYLPESFGLPAMSLEPILRLKDDETAIKENYQRILHPEWIQDVATPKAKVSKIGYWVAAVTVIAFLSFSLSWNMHKTHLYQNESSMIPGFEKKTTILAVKPQTITPAVATTPVATAVEAPAPTIKPLTTNADLSLNSTYVVIGAFFTQARAEKLKLEAEQKGYTVNIIKNDKEKLFHTTIQLENKEAELSLQKIKTEINPQAWVYCVKCRI